MHIIDNEPDIHLRNASKGRAMLPGLELMGCPLNGGVPGAVMHHVVNVESSFNRYAIGVVGGRLVRQPRSLDEALATVRMLEERGFNFSLGLAQVNRYNLAKYGLASYEQAFAICPNLRAGSEILAECHQRAQGNWGKAFSCYYSGNFTTGFRQGYVQKIERSMWGASYAQAAGTPAIQVIGQPRRRAAPSGLPYRATGTASRAGANHVAPQEAGLTLLQRRGNTMPTAAAQIPANVAAASAPSTAAIPDTAPFQPALAASQASATPVATQPQRAAVLSSPSVSATPNAAQGDAAFVF